MKVTVSVPGKVHLMGEHTVVYGKPALLAAINLRMKITIDEPKGKNPGLHIQLKDTSGIIQPAPDILAKYIYHIENLVITHFHIQKKPLVYTIQSDIPFGYHLGSSAALAVGTVGALTYYLKKIWNPILINQLAYEAEKYQHGNPSGGDNTTITSGGLIWFRKELEFLKSMWQLPFTFPGRLQHFYLLDTGKPMESTGEMVEYVRSQFTVHSSRYKKLFDQNEEQVKKVAIAIKEQDEKSLLDAIKMGERTLKNIGVVSRNVIPCIREMEKRGGVAKILGGGGRKRGVGFLLCYHPDSTIVDEVAGKFGYKVQPVTLGGEGIKLEK